VIIDVGFYLMRSKAKRIAIKVSGWCFIVLGILGLVLPILQGILFLLVGLYLLSDDSPWAARVLHRVRKKFPKIHEKFEEAKLKAREVRVNLFKKKQRQEGG
jgi:uncharacterized membrane protein YbaN (DUF454 family)